MTSSLATWVLLAVAASPVDQIATESDDDVVIANGDRKMMRTHH